MKRSRALRGAVLISWLAAASCSTLREIPRGDYPLVAERRGVRVETREGLVYDFDYAAFSSDSLTGYRHRSDVEGPVDQTVSFQIALGDIDHLTTRKLDWYRTGLVAALVGALGRFACASPGWNGAPISAWRQYLERMPGLVPEQQPAAALAEVELGLAGRRCGRRGQRQPAAQADAVADRRETPPIAAQ